VCASDQSSKGKGEYSKGRRAREKGKGATAALLRGGDVGARRGGYRLRLCDRRAYLAGVRSKEAAPAAAASEGKDPWTVWANEGRMRERTKGRAEKWGVVQAYEP